MRRNDRECKCLFLVLLCLLLAGIILSSGCAVRYTKDATNPDEPQGWHWRVVNPFK